MQNKLITAGQLVVRVIRADVVRGGDSDVGTRLAWPKTPAVLVRACDAASPRHHFMPTSPATLESALL